MGIIVHHQPANTALLWNIHAWEAARDGNNVWIRKEHPATGSTFNVRTFVIPASSSSSIILHRAQPARMVGKPTISSGIFLASRQPKFGHWKPRPEFLIRILISPALDSIQATCSHSTSLLKRPSMAG